MANRCSWTICRLSSTDVGHHPSSIPCRLSTNARCSPNAVSQPPFVTPPRRTVIHAVDCLPPLAPVHRSSANPFVSQSVRRPIRSSANPFVSQSVRQPIRSLANPFVNQSVRLPIRSSEPFCTDSASFSSSESLYQPPAHVRATGWYSDAGFSVRVLLRLDPSDNTVLHLGR
jgi:hypothetical protein